MHTTLAIYMSKTSLISLMGWFALVSIKITLFLLGFFCRLQRLKPFQRPANIAQCSRRFVRLAALIALTGLLQQIFWITLSLYSLRASGVCGYDSACLTGMSLLLVFVT